MATAPTAGARSRRGRGSFAVLRALLRQRRRLLLAGVAIALGVGYLAGALGLLDRIGAGLDELATVSADEADLVIEGEVAYESSLEQVRRLVPSALLQATAGIPGVRSVSHRLEDTALLVDSDGNAVVAPSLSEQPLGVNWPEDDDVSTLDFVEGGPPLKATDVAIDERSAEASNAGVGDEVTVAGKGKVGRYEVSGIVEGSATGATDGSSLVVLTTPEARLVFDRPIDDNRIAVTLESDADPDEVMRSILAVAPPGVVVVDSDTAAQHAQDSLTRSFSLVRALVVGFGVLALAVGMLTVANSLGLLHAQRRRLFASFRLVGATVGQLRRAAFAEAGLLALLASIVGIPVGLLIAGGIERALGALGTAVPTAGPLLSLRAAVIAVGVGLVATMLAAWRPVTSACRVPPVEAVSEADPPPAKGWSGIGVAAGRAVVFSALAVGVALLAGVGPSATAIAAGLTGAVVLLLSVTPWLLAQTVAATMRLVPFRPWPLRRVAARDVARNPRRTASTTAAVLLAAAVVSSLAVFLESFTTSVDGAVEELISADVVVDSETFTRGGLPSDLVDQLGFVDGVEQVSGWQLGRGSVGEFGVRLTGLDGETALDVISPEWQGEPGDLDAGSAWISAGLAERTGLGVGDATPVLFTSGGAESLVVTGVYETGQALLGELVTDREVLVRQVPATIDLAALLVTDGDASTIDGVSELAASYGVSAVVTPEEFVDGRSDLLRGFQRVVQWMLLFTLLQALVGVINTLVLSVGERRREFGLLRVSGASRRQVLRMVLFEGTSLAAVGTLLGLAVGVAGAAIAVRALGGLGLDTFSVPVLTVVAIAVVAVLVGVAAAWLPARVAASVPPLEAVLDSGAEVVHKGARPAKPPETTAVPAAAPVPAASAPLGAAAAAAAAPPPFDPARLAAAVASATVVGTAATPAEAVATLETSMPANALLGVVVWDGETVHALDTDDEEAAALLALYGAQAPVAETVSPPQATPHPAPVAPAPPLAPEMPAAPVAPAAPASTPLPTPAQAPAAPQQPVVPPAIPAAPMPAPMPSGFTAPAQPPMAQPQPGFAQQAPETAPAPQEPPAAVPPAPAAVPPTPPLGQPPMPPAPPIQLPGSEPPPPHQPVPTVQPAQRSPEPHPSGDKSASRRERLAVAASRLPRRRTRRGAPTGAADGWINPSASAPTAQPTSGEPGAATTAPRPPARDADRRSAELSERAGLLDPESVARGANAIGGLGQNMAEGEQLGALVVGRVKSWPAALGRTERRLLLVVDRSDRLAVESLHPTATTVTVRPGVSGTVTVVLVDSGRILELTEVVDSGAAESLIARAALTS